MRRRLFGQGMLRDQTGVALTEFAIVMPVLLLFFFAMVQFNSIVQAAMLGDYAAYVAARSYAVQEAVDAKGAEDTARNAAAMALAPVAELMPGEIGPIGSITFGLVSSFLGGPGKLLDGYFTARYIRLAATNFSVDSEGTPKQVQVKITYPQPIFLPGLAGMWNLVAGPSIASSLSPLASGALTPGPLSSLPYVTLKSQCWTGHEDWGSQGKHDDWRPRRANSDPPKWD